MTGELAKHTHTVIMTHTHTHTRSAACAKVLHKHKRISSHCLLIHAAPKLKQKSSHCTVAVFLRVVHDVTPCWLDPTFPPGTTATPRLPLISAVSLVLQSTAAIIPQWWHYSDWCNNRGPLPPHALSSGRVINATWNKATTSLLMGSEDELTVQRNTLWAQHLSTQRPNWQTAGQTTGSVSHPGPWK